MGNIKRQSDYYENLLRTYGDHFLSLDWKAPESQEMRFKIFKDFVDMFGLHKFSVLDIGSGFGDLYNYFLKNNFRFSYKGYDVSSKIIEMAKKKYPNADFELHDILSNKKSASADFVFCCGALNISFDDRETHLTFIHSMLIRMFQLCKIGVAVNFLSSQAIYHLRDEDLTQRQYFYTKVEEILPFVKSLTGKYVIRHDYHPGDFTVYIIKG